MHTIEFDHAESSCTEALPLGNGCFGAMLYANRGRMFADFNHYEAYYSGLPVHLRTPAGEPMQAYLDRMERNRREIDKEAFVNYRRSIWPEADVVKRPGNGAFQPHVGRLCLVLDPSFSQEGSLSLELEIEKARVICTAQKADRRFKAESIILQGEDVYLLRIQQTAGSLCRAELTWPAGRAGAGIFPSFEVVDERTVRCVVDAPSAQGSDPFHFVTTVYLAEGVRAEKKDDSLWLIPDANAEELTLLLHTATSLSGPAPEERSLACLHHTQAHMQKALEEHRGYWEKFFSASAVHLPDGFLERLWYYNLYILACCSGKDGKRREQACGLNGLWDIRSPTIWGSMWYWDVNIQAAFWPVYTANHLELAQVFQEGFLEHVPDAEQRAQDFYGAEGYAIDYPHEFYNCIGPWCAQYLWWYYAYSGDLAFLRDKAYPVFRKQIRFVEQVFPRDSSTGKIRFYPDIAPEQGPVACNSVITVAVVRDLLDAALEAGRLLGEDAALLQHWESLKNDLPEYPLALSDRWGTVWRDSETAPPVQPLRHPSLLMPIFPSGQIGQNSEAEVRAVAENTVRMAETMTELGVFQFGWIACAAARLGLGQMALRVLYEKGLDCILRPNGMGAEETDRFVNHCLVERGDLNFPAMMECVGEIPEVINEMLLQSHDGVISVFPAVPDGRPDKRAGAFTMEPLEERDVRPAPDWKDCGFETLCAQGGFLVSAQRRNGRTVYIRIESTFGTTARVRVPDGWKTLNASQNGRECPVKLENGVAELKTQPGEVYLIAEELLVQPAALPVSEAPKHYVSHLGRRVFAGKDALSDTVRAMDSWLFDSYVGNDRVRVRPAWRFSFGTVTQTQRPLQHEIYPPARLCDREFFCVTQADRFVPERGYGFVSGNVQEWDGERINRLLRDGLAGWEKAVFAMDLPQGVYALLAVCGMDGQDSFTALECGDTRRVFVPAGGRRTAVLHVIHEGGSLKIALGIEEKLPWSVSALLVKKLQTF